MENLKIVQRLRLQFLFRSILAQKNHARLADFACRVFHFLAGICKRRNVRIAEIKHSSHHVGKLGSNPVARLARRGTGVADTQKGILCFRADFMPKHVKDGCTRHHADNASLRHVTAGGIYERGEWDIVQIAVRNDDQTALRQPSDFRDPKVRQRILSLTQGVLGRVCRLMETAAVEAIRSSEERITLALLKEELVTESLVSIADRQARRLSV